MDRGVRWLVGGLALLSAGGTTVSGVAAQEGWDPFVEVRIPTQPIAVPAGGERHIAYELHVTNFTMSLLRLDRVAVLAVTGEVAGDDAPEPSPLLELEGTSLRNVLLRPGLEGSLQNSPEIGPGLRAIVYMWVEVDRVPPDGLEMVHELVFQDPPGGVEADEAGEVDATPRPEAEPADVAEAESPTRRRTLRTARLSVPAEPPVDLGPPLRGGPWVAGNGPSNFSLHRRALLPVGGLVRIAQRFAIDFVQPYDDGRTWKDDQAANDSYRCYGAEILAVADGVVVDTKDGIPENVPGVDSRAVEITLETIAGNYVILDIGGGQYAFYAHIQPGTVRVRTGDRVRRGDVLGLVGNSGNSTEPHLHFHLGDAPSPLSAEGIPYTFPAFDVIGRFPFWSRATATGPERREGEIPLHNQVIEFPR